MAFDDILDYDSDMDALMIGDDEKKTNSTKSKADERATTRKRKNSEDSTPSTSGKHQHKRKKPDLEDTMWKMTRSRFGQTTYRCGKCLYKKIKIFRKNGKVYMLQELCEECAEGNVYMSDVYYRYFGKKSK
ncbi:hypothetical protein AAVH_29225 [Aphelenchoides avenae]|nr:hypothetical protein AAVH_29225 [Aphelenchus avenae]